MIGRDGLAFGQIRDGSRDLQDAVVGAFSDTELVFYLTRFSLSEIFNAMWMALGSN
jgi:hypothetical protein